MSFPRRRESNSQFEAEFHNHWIPACAGMTSLRMQVMAEIIVRWTARLFVACYLARVLIDASGRRDVVWQRRARLAWTVGCAVCLLHIVLSMALVHGWSHALAYDHVLKRTVETTGFRTGIGLYVNYAFAGLWVVDTLLWWRNLAWSERRVPYWTVQTVFGFLVSQATVVFGPPFWTPVAVAIVLVLAGLKVAASRRNRTLATG